MLRPLEEKDLDGVREERNRPDIRCWFRQSDLLSMKDQLKWFNTTDMKTYVYYDEEEDIYGAVVSLSHIDLIARKCEFSIFVHHECRGKGYGRLALFELLYHAFNDLNMNQVYSDVFEHNPALEKYVKWGFKKYGTLPQWYWKDGKYINSVIISITKDEYNSLKQTISG